VGQKFHHSRKFRKNVRARATSFFGFPEPDMTAPAPNKTKREKLPDLLYPDENDADDLPLRVCHQCDQRSDSLGQCPRSTHWFCDDQCRVEYRLEHPNIFATEMTHNNNSNSNSNNNTNALSHSTQKQQKQAPPPEKKRDRSERSDGDKSERKKKKKKLDERREREQQKRRAADAEDRPVVLQDTLAGPAYEETEQAKRRLRNERLQWQQEKGKSSDTLNAQRIRNIQQTRDSVLRIYQRQIHRLTDHRYHLERSLTLWDETRLVGDRAPQIEAWIQHGDKLLGKLQAVHDDIAKRYSDESLGVAPQTTTKTPSSAQKKRVEPVNPIDLTRNDDLFYSEDVTEPAEKNKEPEEIVEEIEDDAETEELMPVDEKKDEEVVMKEKEVEPAAAVETTTTKVPVSAEADDADEEEEEEEMEEVEEEEMEEEEEAVDEAETPEPKSIQKPKSSAKKPAVKDKLSPISANTPYQPKKAVPPPSSGQRQRRSTVASQEEPPVRALQLDARGGFMMWNDPLPLRAHYIEQQGYRLHGQSADQKFDLYCQTFRPGREPKHDDAYWAPFIEAQFGVRVSTKGDVLAVAADGAPLSEALTLAARDFKPQPPQPQQQQAPQRRMPNSKKRVLNASNLLGGVGADAGKS